MNVSYQPLWNILENKKMKKKNLIEIANISENCVANMGNNKYVSMVNIGRICKVLECTPNYVFQLCVKDYRKKGIVMIKNSRKKNIVLSPIVKWVGGKRQLLEDIIPLIPKTFTTYVEPFVGGGAVLFDIQPKKAIINDFNHELINIYKIIRDNPNDLISALQEHERLNSEEYFYKIRALDRTEQYDEISDVEKAARIIYLNKTCYNGLFRVNQAGQFNSPYGKYKNPNIVNMPVVLAMSKYFNESNVKIIDGDYKTILKNLRKGAFVYFDPPYMPISSSSSFTGYTENGFDKQQQVELKEECDKLNAKGIKFLLSNSDHPFIRELYKDYEIITVKAKRSINSNGNKRGEINEVLVRNYD